MDANANVQKIHVLRSTEEQRHADALADVRKMHEDLIAAREEIAQLKADLHREETRVILLVDDRDRFRAEAHKFRSLLIELATKMVDIGLLTVKAEEILKTVHEIDAAPPAITSEALARLNQDHAEGNATAVS